MVPSFGDRSNANLKTCDQRIQVVMNEVIRHVDCSVLEGARTDAKQAQYFADGKSHLDGVTKRSKHQVNDERPLSFAIDVVAYPIDWSDRDRFCLFDGFVLGTAYALGIPMICGIDWDFDFSASDHTFFDGPHFELLE